MSLYKDASLVMIPSAYKDGKLYSIRPTDGSGDFTFSRNNGDSEVDLGATRVDVNGLIEKGRENLLVQSNQFDTTWIKASSLTLTSGQSGYNGSSDAWKLESDGSSGYDVVYQDVVFSNLNTYSIYAKAGTNTSFSIRSLSGTDARGIFDLSAGSVSSTSGTIDASIVSVGGDWYRCSITFSGSNNAVYIYPNALGSASAGYIYIQDAQLEAGLVATDYIETTSSTAQAGILEDMPRLDYSGSCPALLLEPQRTNLIPHSEYLNSGDYFKTGTTITDNYGISPEGVQNSSLFNFGATGSSSNFGETLAGLTAGTSITYTIYAKGSGTIRIYSDGNGSGGYFFYSTNITLTNEWVRQELKYTIPAGVSAANFVIQRQPTDTATQAEFYGFQVEAGSYPTSYIPTYGASVTRSKDNCVSSSLTTSTDFTIFFEAPDFCLINGSTGGSYDSVQFVFSADGNPYSASGSYHIYNNTLYHNNGSGGNQGFGNIYNNQTDSKFVIMKRGDKVLVFANGTKKTEATLPSGGLYENWDTINLTQSLQDGQGDVFNPYYKQVVKFDTALTDSECIALTTL